MQTNVQQGFSQDSPIGNAAKGIEKGLVARTVRNSGKIQVQAPQVNIGSPSVFIFHVDLKGTYQRSYRIRRHVVQLEDAHEKRVRFHVQEPGYPCDTTETGNVPITTKLIRNAPLNLTEEFAAQDPIGLVHGYGLNLPPDLVMPGARFNDGMRLQRASQYRIEGRSVQVKETVRDSGHIVVGSPQPIPGIDHGVYTGALSVDLL